MHRAVLIILILITAFQLRAQFIRADHKKAEIMYHRPVIVTQFELSKAENHCDSVHMQWYNENIAGLMKEYWKLNDSIMVMDRKRLASIIGSKSPEYAVFMARPSREGQQSSNEIYWYRSFTFMLFLSEDGVRIDPDMVDRNSPIIPDTDNTGHLLRGRYVFKLSMADLCLSTGDIKFVIGQFNRKVQLALEQRYAKKGLYGEKVPREFTSSLKNKTLLLPEDLFPDKIDREELTRLYKYPFRISRQDEIQEAISSEEKNTAYIHYFWSDRERMFLGGVIDTQSGNVLAMLKPNALKLEDRDCLPAGVSYRQLIRMKPNHLKKLSRSIK